MPKEIVIVGAARTAVGRFGGVFKNTSATILGITAVIEAMKRAKIQPDQVDELIFGNVLSTGLGQNIARQIQINSGIPINSNAFTINKVCASGLKSVMLAAQAIMCDDSKIVVAGGTENMSQAPYILHEARWGQRMGNGTIIDSMIFDGLTDIFNGYHMGITAENIAKKYNITREDQDILALLSQQNAEKAIINNRFKNEIVPVKILQKKSEPKIIEIDEHPRFGTTLESLSKIPPAFKKDGTVTAGNASGINDGAAAVIITTKEKAKQLGLTILAKIKGYGWGGVDPAYMGLGPIIATKTALNKTNVSINDIDLIESNEAFAAQTEVVIRELKLKRNIINVNGGAIALGHPIGASGCRILVTLLYEMIKRDSKLGLATLCIGGGQGASIIIER